MRCYSRNGVDWSQRLGRITASLQSLKLADTWLDGELIIADEQGRCDFQRLQRQLEDGDEAGLTLYVFDILVASGEDLRIRPLSDRRRLLQKTLAGLAAGNVRLLDYVDGFDPTLWKEVCRTDREGLVVRDADAPYRAGRNRAWLKLKCRRSDEFVIGGFTRRAGGRSTLTSLLLGTVRDGRLVFAGRAGTGFDERDLVSLQRRLRPTLRKTSPFEPVPVLRRDERPCWVEPKLVAQVRYAGWTRSGLLRQPVFLALREDRDPADVGSPKPAGPATLARKQARKRKEATALTYPTRVVFPEDGVTKEQLATYYDAVSPAL